jgi:catalase
MPRGTAFFHTTGEKSGLEDFHVREKIMRFDHERVPERVVHARGAAAHGVSRFMSRSKTSLGRIFYATLRSRLPFSRVFRRSRVRDVGGYSARRARVFTKLYTQEGNFDLVGTTCPVFFIQDAIKFLYFVHAVKPEPHNEMPRRRRRTTSFWDFLSL